MTAREQILYMALKRIYNSEPRPKRDGSYPAWEMAALILAAKNALLKAGFNLTGEEENDKECL